MPPSSPTNRKLSNPSPTRNQLVERCSTLRGCEPCKRRKRICNGGRPCTHCIDEFHDCVYSVVSDHPRSVFTTNTARRLSSGSACETCRRRKTKCDGNSPCSFCASNGIECINNSERRKRSVVASSLSAPSNVPITSSSLANSSLASSSSSSSSLSLSDNLATNTLASTGAIGDNEAIDRIEDRLRRIEKLMTAFTPSPLSQSPLTKEIKELKHAASGFRKMSSPHLQHQRPNPTVRQQRHSIHSVSLSSASTLKKEHCNNNMLYASPPNSNGSSKSAAAPPANTTTTTTNATLDPNHTSIVSPSPPLSPRILKQSSSQHSPSVVASSMLNLSLSPSSSSTSSSSYMQPSISTPTSPLATNSSNDQHQWSHNNNTSASPSSLQKEWKQSSPIPSLMDQLSKCTFVTTAMDYTTVHYPIYPITPPLNSNTAINITTNTTANNNNNSKNTMGSP